MAITEASVHEELSNICANYPVFAGEVISHDTARELVRRGWAGRDENGDYVPTEAGKIAWLEWTGDRQDNA